MTDRSSLTETRTSRIGICRLGRRRGLVPAVMVVAALFCASSAPKAFAFGSALPCTTRPTSAAFSRWLDPAQYFLASNGGFEQKSNDWSLSPNAAVVTGNEPYSVAGPKDSHSLSLGAGATAESRTACVTMGEPTVRLFVKTPRVIGATLTIDATVVNPTTGVSLATKYVVVGGVTPAGWAPTPQIVIPNLVGGILPENLTLRFTVGGAPATWSIDDVFIDPFHSR